MSSSRRKKNIASATEAVDFGALESELNSLVAEEDDYWTRNAAKFRAAEQCSNYDDFQNIVKVSLSFTNICHLWLCLWHNGRKRGCLLKFEEQCSCCGPYAVRIMGASRFSDQRINAFCGKVNDFF
jgi:hypothetical protein